MSMQIKGLNSLIGKINRLGGSADDALLKGIQKSILLVEGDAKDLCPVASSELRSSINSKVKKDQQDIKGSVGTNKAHAAYVEFGTGQRGERTPSPPKAPTRHWYREDWRGMAAQPYLYPALMKNKKHIKAICIGELNKEIKRLGGH